MEAKGRKWLKEGKQWFKEGETCWRLESDCWIWHPRAISDLSGDEHCWYITEMKVLLRWVQKGLEAGSINRQPPYLHVLSQGIRAVFILKSVSVWMLTCMLLLTIWKTQWALLETIAGRNMLKKDFLFENIGNNTEYLLMKMIQYGGINWWCGR